MECIICTDIKDEKEFETLPCTHKLCNFCYNELNKVSNLCPYCRRKFREIGRVTHNNELPPGMVRVSLGLYNQTHLRVTLPQITVDNVTTSFEPPDYTQRMRIFMREINTKTSAELYIEYRTNNNYTNYDKELIYKTYEDKLDEELKQQRDNLLHIEYHKCIETYGEEKGIKIYNERYSHYESEDANAFQIRSIEKLQYKRERDMDLKLWRKAMMDEVAKVEIHKENKTIKLKNIKTELLNQELEYYKVVYGDDIMFNRLYNQYINNDYNIEKQITQIKNKIKRRESHEKHNEDEERDMMSNEDKKEEKSDVIDEFILRMRELKAMRSEDEDVDKIIQINKIYDNIKENNKLASEERKEKRKHLVKKEKKTYRKKEKVEVEETVKEKYVDIKTLNKRIIKEERKSQRKRVNEPTL